MRHFNYKNGELFAENVPVREIAEQVGTPTYIYSSATLQHHFKSLQAALGVLNVKIAFAVKSNTNRAVIATLARLGAGADTVSEGEIRRAINAGVAPEKIVFSGVGKTVRELEYAVSQNIHQINIESIQELETLSEVATRLGKIQKIVFRVNPDVAAGGHDKISTGKKTSKFGISKERAFELYARAETLNGVEPVGLAVHIGSQIIDLAPLKQAYEFLAQMVKDLRAKGHKVSRLDLGGGLAAIYQEDVEGPDLIAWGKIVRAIIHPLDVEIEIEPGRIITANAGVLIARAIVTKDNGGRDFVVLDAAMNDLMRPAFYEAYHQLLAVNEPVKGTNKMPTTIVGPICETGDTFAVDRLMEPVAPDDLVAFMSAGAYGFSMASNYNSRPLAAEVLVDGDKWEVVRPRQTYEEIFGMEKVPSWL
jgi:diaminopimelate decarboxylase